MHSLKKKNNTTATLFNSPLHLHATKPETKGIEYKKTQASAEKKNVKEPYIEKEELQQKKYARKMPALERSAPTKGEGEEGREKKEWTS